MNSSIPVWIAEKAKLKGFNWGVRKCYTKVGEKYTTQSLPESCQSVDFNQNKDSNRVSAPSYNQIIRWFKSKYSWIVDVSWNNDFNIYTVNVQYKKKKKKIILSFPTTEPNKLSIYNEVIDKLLDRISDCNEFIEFDNFFEDDE